MKSESALQHIPEETLEQYCMGRLPESEIEPIEDHLLVCHPCQDSLTETEEFLRAVRSATEELQAHPIPEAWWKQWWHNFVSMPKPVFAAAACAVALIVVMPTLTMKPAAEVELRTMRGPEDAVQAPANTKLSLRLSLEGVDATGPLQVRVANTSGELMDQSPAKRSDGHALATVGKLAPGSYWARLYSNDEMVGEYSIIVR